jgi:hypothetical protein
MADLHEIQLADGTKFRTALPPSRLVELGLPELPPTPSLGARGALALGDGAGGASGNPTASDARPNYSAGGSGSGNPSGSDGTGHQPSDTTAQAPPAVATQVSADQAANEKGRASNVGRFGAATTDLDVGGDTGPGPAPVERPRYVTIRAGDTKGADIRTGYSVQKSDAAGMLPEHEEQAADARISAKLAGQELADNKADTLERERGAAVEEQIRREEQAAALQAKQAEIQRRKEEAASNLLALDAEHDEIQKLKVNPNQFWDGLGTGGKILAAIGMIAGGINSGLRGGPNQAAEFIYRAIRDDINGQREKIEARRQGFNIRETRLDKRAAQLGGDLELAARELEANQLALVSAIGKKHAAESGLANINPELMLTFAKMDEEAANMRLDNAAKYSAKVQESFAFIPDKTVQVGGQAIKPDARERMVELGDGRRGFARTNIQAKEAQDKLTPGSDIIAGLNELRELRKQSAEVDVTPTQMSAIKNRMRAIALGLAPRMNVQVGQGAMSKDEVEQNMQKMGDPEAIVKGSADAAIEETIRIQERANRSIARDYLYADPDATTPLIRGQAQGGLRREQ